MGCHVAPLLRLAKKGWTGNDLVRGAGLRACGDGGAPTAGQHARVRTRIKTRLGKRRLGQLRRWRGARSLQGSADSTVVYGSKTAL
eukprot:5586024-Amphidinium_carterae.3